MFPWYYHEEASLNAFYLYSASTVQPLNDVTCNASVYTAQGHSIPQCHIT